MFNWLNKLAGQPKYDALIVGYFGMHNTGDDALMLASQYIAKYWLNCRHVCITSADATYSTNNQVAHCHMQRPQRFKGQNKIQQLKAAARSKHIIFGGGSVLHRYQDIAEKRLLMRLASSSQHLALGVSIGPFNDNKAKRACAAFLNECQFVGVRDQQSFDLGKEIAPQANIHKTFDLAPLLTLLPEFNPEPQVRQGIYINICPVATNSFGQQDHVAQENLKQQWCECISQLWQQTHEPITLISFNGHGVFGDDKLCQEIVYRLSEYVPVNMIGYQPNPFATLHTLSHAKLVIGMRLHACIFSFLTATPVIAVNYHEKGEAWCKEAGMASNYCFNANQLNGNDLTKQAIQIIQQGYVLPQLTRDEALTMAKQNWRLNHEINQDISSYSFV